jgi:hypothetical protein
MWKSSGDASSTVYRLLAVVLVVEVVLVGLGVL